MNQCVGCAIEQASRRWRGGRRDDAARTRRKILISTQVTDVVPDREAVKTGLDYSMHGMLAHHGDDIDAYPNRPDGRKKKPIEPTAEMDGSGAKIQVQLPAE